MRFKTLSRSMAMSIIDFRNIVRDPTLSLLFIAPLLIIGIFRWGLPEVSRLLSGGLGFDLTDHYSLIAGFIVMLPAMLMGMLTGFLILDERDENMLSYFMITPPGRTGYLFYRLTSSVPYVWVTSALILIFTRLVPSLSSPLIWIVLMISLQAPLFTLILASLADNKVEGLAIGKGVSMMYVAAFVPCFVTSRLQYLAGIFPPFWVMKSFLIINHDGPALTVHLLAGFLIHSAWMVLFFIRFYRRHY